jgi:hypothetical protein
MINIYKIISLGSDCLPRYVLTKGKIMKTKEEGTLSCPFDLILTPYSSLCQLIDNDFTDFTNPEFFDLKSGWWTVRIADWKDIVNTKYDLVFSHESEVDLIEDYRKNNYELLIKRYNERIKNFYYYMNEGIKKSKTEDSYIIFLLRHNEYPDKLNKILKKKFPGLNFLILTLNIGSEGMKKYEQIDILDSLNKENVSFYNLPYPYNEYIWYEEEHNNSQSGKDFEKSICNILYKIQSKSFYPV